MRERQEDGVQQEGRLVVGQQLPESIIVNEVELRPTSRLRELRAACNFFRISQSGSRMKCFQRLVR